MAAKKKMKKGRIEYVMGLEEEEMKGGNYVGVVRGSFGGREWGIFKQQDDGEKQIGNLRYEFNLFGMNGPRKM